MDAAEPMDSESPDPSRSSWTEDEVRRLEEFARSLVRDLPIGADDVVAETLAVALRLRPPEGKAPGPWLRGIARNVVRNLARGDRRRRDRERSTAPREGDDSDDDPLRIAASNEESARVRAALASLAEPARRILETRYLDGETPHAIALRLGVPPATIRSRILRGIGALRLAFGDSREGRSSRGAMLVLARILAAAACAFTALRYGATGGDASSSQERAPRARSSFAKVAVRDSLGPPQGMPSAEELRSLPRRHPAPSAVASEGGKAKDELAKADRAPRTGDK